MVPESLREQRKESVGGTKMAEIRDIGVDVAAPTGDWDGDANCPFYGSLRLRGQIIEGQVSTTGMSGSIVVEREITRYMKKVREIREENSKIFSSSTILHRRSRSRR